jgi:metal-responsive CopG/Arc/MetJ family transcriptional regulator
MKEEIRIVLSSDLLAKIDQLAGPKLSRSAFIERVLQTYLGGQKRRTIHARDMDRINAAADRLNAEADEVLGYQHASKDKSI